MADPSPLITIGLTVHNAASTLERAIRSALAQDWPNFEIVAVDDCSTDGSAVLLVAYPALRVIRNDANRGVAFSRNRIIDAARGDYIAFFDDDDESAPDRLTVQYHRLAEYERDFAAGALIVCHAARTQIYPRGVERYAPTMGMRENALAPHGEAVIKRILFNEGGADSAGALATCSQMGRRAMYRAVGGFDANFRRGEDTDFALRLAALGGHFVGVARPLVRQTMTLAADKKLATERQQTLALFDKHRALLGRRYAHSRGWMIVKYDFLEHGGARFMLRLLHLALRHPVLTMRQLCRAVPSFAANRRRRALHRSGGA